jgi:hypothetical protein
MISPGGANVCIVLGKWVCQTFIYGYIVTKYGCNCLKYIFPKEVCIILHSTCVFMSNYGCEVKYNQNLDTMYLRTISCLQNTLIYIIIVCKQTSALHIINPRIYHILRKHVFSIHMHFDCFILWIYIVIKNRGSI